MIIIIFIKLVNYKKNIIIFIILFFKLYVFHDKIYCNGHLVILDNCNSSLEYMGTLEETLNPKDKVIREVFRLWITC